MPRRHVIPQPEQNSLIQLMKKSDRLLQAEMKDFHAEDNRQRGRELKSRNSERRPRTASALQTSEFIAGNDALPLIEDVVKTPIVMALNPRLANRPKTATRNNVLGKPRMQHNRNSCATSGVNVYYEDPFFPQPPPPTATVTSTHSPSSSPRDSHHRRIRFEVPVKPDYSSEGKSPSSHVTPRSARSADSRQPPFHLQAHLSQENVLRVVRSTSTQQLIDAAAALRSPEPNALVPTNSNSALSPSEDISAIQSNFSSSPVAEILPMSFPNISVGSNRVHVPIQQVNVKMSSLFPNDDPPSPLHNNYNLKAARGILNLSTEGRLSSPRLNSPHAVQLNSPDDTRSRWLGQFSESCSTQHSPRAQSPLPTVNNSENPPKLSPVVIPSLRAPVSSSKGILARFYSRANTNNEMLGVAQESKRSDE